MATKPVSLLAEPRAGLGTRATRRLRNSGKLPAIVYGHKQDAVNVAVDSKIFNESIHKGAHVFELNIAGKAENTLLKDVQYDHLGTNIIHIDFARVDLNEKVTVTVGIILKGEAPGTKEGGVVQQVLSELEVECVVTDIPGDIIYNISGLKLDDTVHIRDLKLPSGVVATQDGELIVVVCHAIKETEAEAGDVAEPEVIKKEKADADAAAAAAAEPKK